MSKWIKLIPVLLIIGIGFGGRFLQANEEEPFQNRINLALRQTGHNLLMAQGDSTTAIAPVLYNEGAGFMLPLHSSFEYAQLPGFLAEAFADYNISEPYELVVKNCEDDLNLLGFNRKAVENENIPCLERTALLDCANIYVQFPDREPILTQSNEWMYGLILASLMGIGLLFFRSSRPSPSEESSAPFLPIGSYQFDPENQLLRKGNQTYTLTFREAKLLRIFAQHPNKILTRDHLQAAVWEDEGIIVGRSLDVFVSRLRKHLKDDSAVHIGNIRGVGYRLEISE